MYAEPEAYEDALTCIENAKLRRGEIRPRHTRAAKAARAAERTRIANALVRYRRVEWDSQLDPVCDLIDGTIVGYVPRPTYRKHVGTSPLVEPPARVGRQTRERGTYTRELVRATTRGHDHVPERPTDA